MKRLCILFLAAIASISMFAYDCIVGGIYYNLNTTDKTAAVTRYFAYSGALKIPSSITYDHETYVVTSIEAYAFEGCTSLTSITLPSSLTSIGAYAFQECTSLPSITLPSSLTSIGAYAFYKCSNLTSVSLPSPITSIPQRAFSYCSKLTTITLPNTVTTIEEFAFFDCMALGSITWSISLKSIGKRAFSGCKSLTSINMPNSVTTLGVDVFSSCENLTSLTLSSKITTIPEYAFYGCKSLTTITFPESVTTIATFAFQNCTGLTKVTLGSKFESMGCQAFYNCPLEEVIFLNPTPPVLCSHNAISSENAKLIVPGIAYSAYINSYWNFYALKTANDLVCIGGLWYKVNTATKTAMVTNNSDNGYSYGSLTGSVVIPESITYANEQCTVNEIGEAAFANSQALNNSSCGITSITIPNTVTSIGPLAFFSGKLTTITIPNSVTSIGVQAFCDCNQLTSVVIGSGVISIGEQAFQGASSLSSIVVDANNKTFDSRDNCNAIIETATNTLVTGCKSTIIPSSVTAIGSCAFSYMGLQSITIPTSVKTIARFAFNRCTIKDVTVGWTSSNQLPSIDETSFKESSATAKLHVPAGTKAIYEAAEVWKEFSAIIDDAPFAIEAVTSSSDKVRKFVCDGQIFIQNGDKIYNAFGGRVK